MYKRQARVAVSAAGLELIAVVHDAADNPLTLCCDFEAVCPGAVDALAAALAATPRFVAGVLEARAAGWRVPTGKSASRISATSSLPIGSSSWLPVLYPLYRLSGWSG